jgi:hypothetical protein
MTNKFKISADVSYGYERSLYARTVYFRGFSHELIVTFLTISKSEIKRLQ